MEVAKHNEETGALWFSTSVDIEKGDEMKENADVAVTRRAKTQYVSLTGKAEIRNDRALIHLLFDDSWKLWCPEGPTQESIRMITFNVLGIKFLWQAGKALVNETELDVEDEKQHGRIVL